MKKLFLFFFALVVSIGTAWADKTIYLNPAGFDNNGNWASNGAVFSAYLWNGSGDGWVPFTETVSIDGKECYKAEIPDSWENMILVRQNPEGGQAAYWDSKWDQSPDISLAGIADNTLFTITSWAAYSTSAVASYSATFATGLDWENVYAYAWNGNTYCLGVWPGTKMTATSETFTIDGTAKTVYSASFLSTAAPANILFNKGEGGAVGVNQTADFAFTDGKFYVLPTANATAPTEPDTRVISIFSKTYNKELTETNNGWGGGPNPKYTSFDFPVINDGHYVVHVNGTAINGRASAKLDADHSILHVALWPKTATSCKIWDDNKYNDATVYTSLTPGQWNYVEIDNVSFTTNYIGIELYNGETPETEFYLDHFYFAKPASGDATAPTFDTHALKSTNCISATLTLQATDETSETITYKVIDTATSTVYETTGASGTAIDFTISPLTASTEYTFSVTAMDENGNETAAETINATTTAIPDIPAITATETHLLWDGNDGGAKNGFNFESWGGGTGSNQTINGKNGYLITNFNYFGSGFTEVDASGMTYLEVDVLPSKTTTLTIVPINRNVNTDGNQPEKGTQFNVTGGEWNKLMVPVADVIADGVTMTRLYQIKFVSTVTNKANPGVTDGFGGGDGTLAFYVGNVYCWTETTVDEEKPVMVSAALASKNHNSATLTLNATDNSGKIKFHIVDATNNIDENSSIANSGEDFSYTVTGLIAETTYNFTITAVDANNNVSENSKSVEVTTDAAPGGQLLVSGEHSILLNGYHYVGTENYELIITSDEVMQGLGGSFWNINGVGGTRVDQNLTISDGGKKLTITATSNQDPQLYTPLYVMMPGEVNFGQPTIEWQERSAAPTEGYYIIGSMNEWELNNSYKLTLNESNTSVVEYYFPSLELTTTSQFKVVYSADGTAKTTWYPDGTGNNYGENGEITSDGNYVIFFRPNGDGGDDWFYNVIYVTSMIDAGVDATTGAHILTGIWDANKFASIDAMDKAAAYDLTGVDFTGVATPINTAAMNLANPFALFITSTPNTVNRNEVVWDATNNRYNGFGLFFVEEWNSNNSGYNIATGITPIQTENPFFQRLFNQAGYYVTMTVPFDYASIPEGAKFYEMSAATTVSGATNITFTEVTSITKNKPYLVNCSIGGITIPDAGVVTIDWADNETTGTAADFKNNYVLQTLDNDKTFVLPSGVDSEADIKFMRAAGATLRPFRAYLEVNDPAAKINVMIDDATGIHAATAEQLEGIFNIYSIDGKIVRQDSNSKVGLPQGIYIINGKKVVIK